MQPLEKIITKGALTVRMLVVSIGLNNYMPFENKKGKKYFHFGDVLTNL